MPGKPFDAIFKDLVESGPDDWPVFVGQPAARTRIIDADIATVSGAADKVLRVEAAVPYLLHLEFVAGHDAAALPRLLHVRNALLENRHDLPVRSVAILLRPQADSPALTGTRVQGFPGEQPYDWFRYQVIRLWQVPVQALLEGGPGVLPLAPISAVTEGDLPGIITELEGRFRRPPLRPRVKELWSEVFLLLGLRYPSDLIAHLLRGVVGMHESTTYQMILDEGMAKGIERGMAKGMAQGMAQGMAKGAIEEARRLIVRVGTERWGQPNARVLRQLESIDNLEQLEALGVRLLQAESWQELLPPRRRTAKRRRES